MAVKLARIPAPQVAAFVADPYTKVVQVPAVAVAETEGPVSVWQKVAGWYKQAIVVVGAIVTLLTQVQTLTPFLPEQYRGWIGIAVGGGSLVLAFLKSNEHWVDDAATII